MVERISIELDSESIAAAREAGLDLSQLLREALHRRLPHLHAAERQAVAQQWYEENKEAIDSYNRFVATHGLFSDRLRKF
ncbi:MAG: acetoacetyl-CoA synthase [Rhizobiales bacterium]|nr:acetoacetyl-CoA synthase [Hyphomicrobiales bacterium]